MLDSNEGLPSPFDRKEPDETDLWFLPGREADAGDFQLSPLPRADRRLPFDPAEWRQAQGDLSAELARLAVRFGALDERLGSLGEGIRQRLAIWEVADLSWWTGARIGAARLTLRIGLHLGGGMDDSLALAQAGWAVRRLTSGQGPSKGGWRDGIGAFLGRNRGDAASAPNDVEELVEVMEACQTLHPVTQGAVLFHAWRIAGQGPARDLEAAVMAACHGASFGRGRALFLPLAMSGVAALRASGSAYSKLAAWIEGAEQATLSASAELDRLVNWQKAARAAISDLSGRTPRMLIDLLAAWPMVSAPMAEVQIEVSRAAVQRNLEMMEGRGLIREITGQGRYRVWVVRHP